MLAALLARQRRVQVLLVAHGAHPDKLDEVLAAAEGAAVPVKTVARDELDGMAHGKSHGGVVLVCGPKPRATFDALLKKLDGLSETEKPLLLLLEGIDDARNLGFTLRTAEAMGCHAVLVKKHLWDFDEAEVSRPSSGAYERMMLVQFEDAGLLAELQKREVYIYGCLAGAKRTIYDRRLDQGVCLAIGGEKRGLSGAVRKRCDRFLTIPSVPGAATLSLTAAAAVALGEARRQRLASAPDEPSARATLAAPPS